MSGKIIRLLAVMVVVFLIIRNQVHTLENAKIAHTFFFDNQKYHQQIHSLAVLGDFNRWDKTSAVPLTDEDGDGLWQATVKLTPGWHEYRFLLNGTQWLRDFSNPVYGGQHSNSRIYIDTVAYPAFLRAVPANGSWLYARPDTLRLFFNRTLSDSVLNLQTLLSFDGLKTCCIVKDSALFFPLPALNDGEHHWQLQLINLSGDTVLDKSGIFFLNLHNQPPKANAGYLRFLRVGERVRLNGGLSYDPDFEPLTRLQWKQLSGPAKATLKNDHTPFPEFQPKAAGVYTFRLTVADSMGQTDNDMTRLVVLNAPPDSTAFLFRTKDAPFAVKKVALAGEFNQWQKNQYFFKADSDSAYWKLRLALPPGQYEYKFVLNDSIWIPDPANAFRIPDGWQGFNSVIQIQPSVKLFLDIDRLGITKNEQRVIVPLKIRAEGDYRVRWFADPHNPGKKHSFRNKQLTFERSNPRGVYFYYAVAESDGRYSRPLTVLIRHYDQTTVHNFSDSPDWPDTSVVYEVYVRTFSAEGNLDGLIRRLPRLKKLGVNVLWLMPVYDGPTEHGYAPTDLFAIEKDYGTLEDYQRLIRTAHRLNMKVIFDFVANHLSDQHRFVRAAVDNLQSPLRKWFFWHSDGRWGYHNDWDTLVNLNYDNPGVRHRMLEVSKFWIGMGVDGFRCDVAWAVPHDFWKDFRREVKKINPELLLIDEVLPRQPAFHDDEFDMSYDTDFYGTLLDVMSSRKPVSAFPYNLKKTAFNYPVQTKNLRYLENHDLERFIKSFGPQKTEIAAALLFTLPGTPLIYQGQEFACLQTRPNFPVIPDQNWFDFYQSLIIFRERNPELTLGTMHTIQTDADGFWEFERRLDKQKTRVLINLSHREKEINFPGERSTLYIKDSGLIRDGKKTWIRPESFIIYKVREQ